MLEFRFQAWIYKCKWSPAGLTKCAYLSQWRITARGPQFLRFPRWLPHWKLAQTGIGYSQRRQGIAFSAFLHHSLKLRVSVKKMQGKKVIMSLLGLPLAIQRPKILGNQAGDLQGYGSWCYFDQIPRAVLLESHEVINIGAAMIAKQPYE